MNDNDLDALLRKSLASSEKPAQELVNTLKTKLIEERYTMKTKKIRKPMVVAAAVVATLSLSVVAFAQPIWQVVQTRVIEGEQYVEDFTMMVSDDGATIMGSVLIGNEDGGIGRVVVEIDGEEVVWHGE